MVSSRVVAMIFAQQTSAENARIAYGSCSKHHLAQPLWPAVRARRPRAWVWAGDIIYGRGNSAGHHIERGFVSSGGPTARRAIRGESRRRRGRRVDGSRRRRGRRADIPPERVAAAPRVPRGYSEESGCRADIPRRRVAATPRPPRGYSAGESRGGAAVPRGYSTDRGGAASAKRRRQVAATPRRARGVAVLCRGVAAAETLPPCAKTPPPLAGDKLVSLLPPRFESLGLEFLEDAYAAQAALPEYAALLREVPEFVATWDDHDFGLNDADATLPFKNASREIFLAVARRAAGTDACRRRGTAATPPRPCAQATNTTPAAAEGVYNSRTVAVAGGSVHIIALDMRFFRTPYNSAGEGDFLGPDQWAWFVEELQTPADAIVVVSSLQLLEGRGGAGENLRGYRASQPDLVGGQPTLAAPPRRILGTAQARTGVASPPRNGVSWTRSPGPRRRSS